MQRSIKFLVILFVILLNPLASFAQKESPAIKELSKGADVIVTGKVTQKKSAWNENKTRIYTRASIQVDEYLKGKSQVNSVEIIYPGGEVGNVGEIYTHMPSFENNEEVLVFLKKDRKNNFFRVFNGEDGKITVLDDKKTGQKVTTSNVSLNSIKAEIKNYIPSNK